MASSISAGMRRARRRSRRNTGRSSACTENSTLRVQDEGDAHVARRRRRRRSGSRSGCAARRCLPRRSGPIPRGRRRPRRSGSSGRSAAAIQPFSSAVGASRSTQTGWTLASAWRLSISSWKSRPLASVKTFSMQPPARGALGRAACGREWSATASPRRCGVVVPRRWSGRSPRGGMSKTCPICGDRNYRIGQRPMPRGTAACAIAHTLRRLRLHRPPVESPCSTDAHASCARSATVSVLPLPKGFS